MSFLSSLGLNLPELIREYGYLFVFVGTMLEGETVLVLGMIAAQQGLLDAWLVGAVAMVGTYIGDLGYYVIGVRFGRVFLDRFPKVESKVQRIKGWIVRYDIAIIIINRFLYGFRIAAPVALGMSAVPALHGVQRGRGGGVDRGDRRCRLSFRQRTRDAARRCALA